MAISPLEKSLSKLLMTKRHIQIHESDPLLMEDFQDELYQLKVQYGQYLNDVLFDIYDDYCEDDPCPDIMEFLLLNEVIVHPDDVPGGQAKLELKTDPLRIEMTADQQNFRQVIWKAA